MTTDQLDSYAKLQLEIKAKRELMAEPLKELIALEEKALELKTEIRKSVEEIGELEGSGWHAYIQIRKSTTYNPEKFVALFPKLADLVTETVINKTKIAGLVKGQFVTEKELEDCAEVTETKAFFLREALIENI